MHKNRLQSFAERTYKKTPIYKVESEGQSHQPKFTCTVEVGDQQFSSTGSFSRKKEAEQDAARVAYEILTTVSESDVKEAFELIDQVRLLTLLLDLVIHHLFIL
jgi:dsRNA-specific ribonuclease